MATVNVYLRDDNNAKDTAWIWVAFYVNRKKIAFSTKITCQKKHWNEKKSCINAADIESKDKNLIIENILARINNVFVKYRLRHKELNRDLFYIEYNKPSDYDTFFDFCDFHMGKIEKYTAEGTMKNHRKAINKLKEYEPNLAFEQINAEFIRTYFSGHLTKSIGKNKSGKATGLGNKHSTAYKDMAVIKQYIFAARKAGYIDNNPFEEFKIKRSAGSFCYFTKEELERVIAYYRTLKADNEHRKSLQLLIYMCFSSQHISDALAMKIQEFKGTSFVYYRVKLRNTKPEPITVPISKSLRWIIAEIAMKRSEGNLFVDMPTEQAMNRIYKKIVANEAIGIDKPVTHKTGRHTFATIYYSATKDLYGLKEILGHSDIRETIKYVHILERDQKKNISVFDAFTD